METWLTQSERKALDSITDLTKTQLKTLEAYRRDLEWCEKNREKLKAEHKNEFLAVKNKEVVDHDPKWQTLMKRLINKQWDQGEPIIESTWDAKRAAAELRNRPEKTWLLSQKVDLQGKVVDVRLLPLSSVLLATSREGDYEIYEAATGLDLGKWTYTKAGRDYIAESKMKRLKR